MKKYIIRIFLLLILLVGINTVKCEAGIYTNNATVNSGATVTITVSSQEVLGTYNLNISSISGLNFTSVSAPGGVTATKTSSTGITGITDSGTSILAYYTFTAPTVTVDTTYKVVFVANSLAAPDLTPVDGSTATATVTVKAPVQPSPVTPPSKAPEPTFSSVNQTVYATTEVNIRSSYSTSSSKIGSLQKGQSVTRTGIGSNGWSRVSYNGQTGYIDSSYLTTTKPAEPSTQPSTSPSTAPETTKSSDATLKNLSITDVEITPAFDSSITSYTATIGEDITEVEVSAQTSNENAKFEITGNTDLQDGENIVTISVTAEDGTVNPYEIKLIKGVNIPLNVFTVEGIKENDEKIDIELGETTITDDIVEYTINLTEYLKSINILGTLDSDLNQYEGLGLFNLEIGENKYTVTLTLEAQEGEEPKTIEYRLTINNPEKIVVADIVEKQNYNLIIIIAIIAIITIAGIVFAILYYKKQNQLEYAQPDYAFLRDDENIQTKEQEREQSKVEQEENKQEQDVEESNNIEESDESLQKENNVVEDEEDDNDSGEKRKGGKHF